jgi:hypothetical protein
MFRKKLAKKFLGSRSGSKSGTGSGPVTGSGTGSESGRFQKSDPDPDPVKIRPDPQHWSAAWSSMTPEISGMGSPAWKRLMMAMLCSMLLDSQT